MHLHNVLEEKSIFSAWESVLSKVLTPLRPIIYIYQPANISALGKLSVLS